MVAKTIFSEADFAAILSGYNLGEFTRSSPVSAGTVQTNYILETTGGKFIFRCYENRSPESVRFECNLLNTLKKRNYPCPAPFRNIHGKYVGVFQGKPFALFEYVEGQHLANPGKAHKRQLIQKVAELHHLTRQYRPRGWEQRWNYSVPLCCELARETAQNIGTANARKKLAWYLAEAGQLALPTALPKGTCHCDFHFTNILFRDDEFAALIDFDDANYTYLIFDLATLINPFLPAFGWDTWAQFEESAEVLDFAQAREVVTEYMKYRPLNPLEQRHLFDVFKLSLLFDCIWYFERGDAGDFYEKRKIDALNRLGREGFIQQLFGCGLFQDFGKAIKLDD
jgi:Ser/Thr protein kinase RdoA (MazF antagonist)